jgi:hypothetical protein
MPFRLRTRTPQVVLTRLGCIAFWLAKDYKSVLRREKRSIELSETETLRDRSGSELVNHIVGALALLLTVGPVYAGDLCTANSFTKSQAEQGKPEYNSSCGLCHLYNLKGRVPGEYQDETPDFRILNYNYMKTLDDNGGVTPPLVGQEFLSKWKDQKAFVDRISTAIMGFPPKNYVKVDSDMRIAAYILYKTCGKVGERSGHH